MPTEDTLLSRAVAQDRDGDGGDDEPTETLAETDTLAARKQHIGGEAVDLDDPQTSVTFEDTANLLSGNHGRPRPREFWTAKQLGQTAPMELIKITVTQQLTGGDVTATTGDGDLSGAAADLATLIEDIYAGPHFQELSLDNLITTAVSDLVDLAWAYWEILPSDNGEFPVAGFKPLPPLQIQHNVDEDTGDLEDDPAFYQVPYKRSSGQIQMGENATELARESVVVMRDPQSSRSGKLYGESIATKVREWLELIVDVDVHQKRHYSDSQLPAGFLHFVDANSDDLEEVEQDIIEASGDPHDLVTVASGPDGGASWIPVGESVVDLDAIQEQQWYFKLVLAAAGLNANELGIVEGSGFAKETPALQRAIYKKVTKPFMNAILQPQNHQVLPRIQDALSASIDDRLRLDLERFDPVQEQIEREEAERAWSNGALSLNEYRGDLGREAEELPVELAGTEVDLADMPKYVVDTLKSIESPGLTVDNGDGDGQASTLPSDSHDSAGPPDFDEDPVLSEGEAFEALGETYTPQAIRQLEDTIEVASSFIESVAYSRTTNFLQIEFERDGPNAVYWYGSVPEYRFRNIIQADSKGKYFNRYIRGEYYYARLE